MESLVEIKFLIGDYLAKEHRYRVMVHIVVSQLTLQIGSQKYKFRRSYFMLKRSLVCVNIRSCVKHHQINRFKGLFHVQHNTTQQRLERFLRPQHRHSYFSRPSIKTSDRSLHSCFPFHSKFKKKFSFLVSFLYFGLEA